jgi:hypothetical protein
MLARGEAAGNQRGMERARMSIDTRAATATLQ